MRNLSFHKIPRIITIMTSKQTFSHLYVLAIKSPKMLHPRFFLSFSILQRTQGRLSKGREKKEYPKEAKRLSLPSSRLQNQGKKRKEKFRHNK
jgi:hypothetical protein